MLQPISIRFGGAWMSRKLNSIEIRNRHEKNLNNLENMMIHFYYRQRERFVLEWPWFFFFLILRLRHFFLLTKFEHNCLWLVGFDIEIKMLQSKIANKTNVHSRTARLSNDDWLKSQMENVLVAKRERQCTRITIIIIVTNGYRYYMLE